MNIFLIIWAIQQKKPVVFHRFLPYLHYLCFLMQMTVFCIVSDDYLPEQFFPVLLGADFHFQGKKIIAVFLIGFV